MARAGYGYVEPEHVVLFTADNPLRLASGHDLGPVEVSYETYGTLSPARDNAVFICHALTGDAHAAGHHGDPARGGWWEAMVGPGRPLDTDRFFVISPNLVGGCQGSTGPLSTNPETGAPYALDFPMLQVTDLVAAHRALLAHLGVRRLAAAVGGSLGGMQVLQWALETPEQLDRGVVIAGSSRLTAQNIAFSAVAREAIMRDPDFAEGSYPGTDRSPHIGLAIARMMAHITYLSEEAMTEKFGRRLQAGDDARRTTGAGAPGDAGDGGCDEEGAGDGAERGRMGLGADFQVESYLHHQGEAFLDRFDALSYLYLSRVMDYYDPFSDPEPLARLAGSNTRFLALSFDSDWRFDTAHSRRIVRVLEQHRVPVSFREIRSPWGHDSFLLEVPGYQETVAAFLAAAAPGAPR